MVDRRDPRIVGVVPSFGCCRQFCDPFVRLFILTVSSLQGFSVYSRKISFWPPKQLANPKNGDRCRTILSETETEETKVFRCQCFQHFR